MKRARQTAGATALHSSCEDLGVEISDLSARLRFKPADAQIWLETERMMMVHLSAFTSLRRELIDTLGTQGARRLLIRMGQASGATDAQIARRARSSDDPAAIFMAGPRLHAIEGMVRAEPLDFHVDAETGVHTGEWIWRNSIEVDAHLAAFGPSSEPVCWHMIGYASAYTSAFMGRPIIYREVECRAMGAPNCRIIGKPVHDWDEESDEDLHTGIDLDVLGTCDEWSEGASGNDEPDRLVGQSSDFAGMMHRIAMVAPTDATVLLMGEPGSGKKSAARLIHQRSARARKPFVVMNCAAWQGEALDIELFGTERGPNGSPRQGRLERAHGGTLFLEDIHCLDVRAQSKLLRALQEKTVERVGSSQPRTINVRLLASANARLLDARRAGQFREDLYYRIATMPIPIPPLARTARRPSAAHPAFHPQVRAPLPQDHPGAVQRRRRVPQHARLSGQYRRAGKHSRTRGDHDPGRTAAGDDAPVVTARRTGSRVLCPVEPWSPDPAPARGRQRSRNGSVRQSARQ
ncbi:sigma-54 dependent transcriptional regulator [Novosphingobium nitrogenifigens DSM 19370]|uniref:Sigma-54 dependent transcriptional regulator n=1 Tax=Novosphingobium nitrogenifigens DSM 19370 TaxID=983920 RepID=F1ZC37_9SPHN|nr:sigma 54-interacting transcriptional regulator [Novosphingobium nitrogenifigens]EGD57826.1 sigma-54 dependent transcriptional regulator [Novosphingobium nitrogenifigens DSM 19370]